MVNLGKSANERPSFGILPLGTANDFVRSCGIPLDPLEALKLVVESEPMPIDLGRDGGRSFINVATGGVGTEITVETPEDLKRPLGGAAYFVTALKRLGKLATTEVSFRGPDFE
jgi:diacylglycerol kinase family enzyme